MTSKIEIYDTTLRDGTQGEGISFSVSDKLRILHCLDEFRVDYVEGGWPGSNPKDIEFFEAAKDADLKHTRLAAFGSTCRARSNPEDDTNLRRILDVETPVVTIFGKSWTLHVTDVFRTTLDENLRMIEDSIRYLHSQGRHVIYDAEHFFDGFFNDEAYALSTLEAASRGGASCLVLCDTNGGTLTHQIGEIFIRVRDHLEKAGHNVDLGIHTHNDSGVAEANSLEAVRQGAVHVQGTINGYGERCGNANLVTVIPNLMLKLERALSIDKASLKSLSRVSRLVSAVANQIFRENKPYVGKMAFAHKGGVHVNSVMKVSHTYEHTTPDVVGNSRRVLVSELSGRSNILHLASQEGIAELETNKDALQKVVNEVKQRENRGFVYEGAEASAVLIILGILGKLPEIYELVTYRTTVDHRRTGGTISEATVKIKVAGEEHLAVGEGVGPVDSLDVALRSAIERFFPEIHGVKLSDYKVRVINATEATHARVRVMIESYDAKDGVKWGTVGVNENIIEASWGALRDSIIYGILRKRDLLGNHCEISEHAQPQEAKETGASASV